MKLIQDVWVIMDKNRKAIACGVPRSREMKMFEDCNSRILTYQSKKKAEAGFKVSGFYDRTREDFDPNDQNSDRVSYLEKTYGKKVKSNWGGHYYEFDYKDFCVALKAQIIIEVDDEKSTVD